MRQSDLSDYLLAEIAVVDPSGAIARTNRKWKETAKIGELAQGQLSWNYIECEAAIRRNCSDAARILDGLREVLNGRLPSFISNYSCPFDGLHHWYQVLISAFVLDGKRHAVVMHVDVSGLQTDPLTALPNRAMFDAQLDLALSLASDNLGRQAGVMIIDVNKLKLINDVHGHRIGDEALRALAAELKKMAGPGYLVARIGGDEFGVILPSNYDALSVRRIGTRLASGITCSIGSGRNPISVAASVGTALYPDDGTTASELLSSADGSMYQRKRGPSVA